MKIDRKLLIAVLALAGMPAGNALAASGNTSTAAGTVTAAVVAPIVLTHTGGSALGFAAQGCVWLALAARGVWMIRAGRTAEHRAAMLMMAAVMSGAIFFRAYLAFWAMLAHGQASRCFMPAMRGPAGVCLCWPRGWC